MSVFSFIRNIVNAISQRASNAWVIKHLEALSDRELADIGLERADIRAYVEGRLTRPASEPSLVRPNRAANSRKGPVRAEDRLNAA